VARGAGAAGAGEEVVAGGAGAAGAGEGLVAGGAGAAGAGEGAGFFATAFLKRVLLFGMSLQITALYIYILLIAFFPLFLSC
jgi:hypothetical protein